MLALFMTWLIQTAGHKMAALRVDSLIFKHQFLTNRMRNEWKTLSVYILFISFWWLRPVMLLQFSSPLSSHGTNSEIRVSTECWPWNFFFPSLLQGFEPMTFWSRVQRSNHWAIPTPCSPVPHYSQVLIHFFFLPMCLMSRGWTWGGSKFALLVGSPAYIIIFMSLFTLRERVTEINH